jgi:hypothetical protein
MKSPCKSLALNGCLPVIISYKQHPIDQTSLLNEYGLLLQHSGDMYSGVPIDVCAMSIVLFNTLAIPKSPSLICPDFVKKTMR